LWNTTNNMNNIGNIGDARNTANNRNTCKFGTTSCHLRLSTALNGPVGNTVDVVDYANGVNRSKKLSTACVETCA